MWVEEQHDRTTYYQRTANVSLGGVYLDGTLPHPRGTEVTLRLELPGAGAPVTQRARVVSDRVGEAPGMHLQFVDEVDDRLAAFLAGV